MSLIWNQFKVYFFAVITFAFGLLGAYAKYQHDKNEKLEDSLDRKDGQIAGQIANSKEMVESHEIENEQKETVIKAEEQKTENKQELEEILDNSENESQEIKL